MDSSDVVFLVQKRPLGISDTQGHNRASCANSLSFFFPWCFCFLGVFFLLRNSLVFLSVFSLFSRVLIRSLR